MLLGEGVKCQKMTHECRGAFLCARGPLDLWTDYKRDDSDPEAANLIDHSQKAYQGFNIERFERPVAYVVLLQNDHLLSLPIDAYRFYNNVIKEKCQFDNCRCLGHAEFKQDVGASILYFSHNVHCISSPSSQTTKDILTLVVLLF